MRAASLAASSWRGFGRTELFKFCLDEDVPVMAHCTGHGAEAGPGKGRHSHVKPWKKPLGQRGYEKLRLNLAHFCSDEIDQEDPATGEKDDWTEQRST